MYNVKVIETPTTKEYWYYELPIFEGVEREKSEERRKTFDEMNALEQAESLKRKANYYQNKRWEIKRLVDCNFDGRSSFLTLTYQENVVDIEKSNYEFDKFIKRLKYYLKKEHGNIPLKYLATWEIQKEREEKYGYAVIHYHVMLFSFPYVPHSELMRLWGNGNVWINKIDHVEKANKGLYVSKYFAKDLDVKEHKKKAFFTSRNLRKPIETKMQIAKMSSDNIADQSNAEHISFQKEYTAKRLINQEMHEYKVRYVVVDKTLATVQ